MSLTVTATASGAGSSNGIEVAVRVMNNASLTQSGAVVNSTVTTTPQLSITPGATGSLVYGAVGTGASSTAFSSIDSGTTSVVASTVVSGGYWGIYKSTSTTTGGTAKTYGWAAPTASSGFYFLAAAEIQASGGTIAEDASTPAVASTSSAKTVTTASFTPPGTSILVAVVLASWTGSGTVSMALTDSASACTWTQLSGTGTTDLVSVWAGIPKGVTSSGGASMVTMGAAGTGSAPFTSAGSVSLASMSAAGSGQVPVISSGGASLASMSAAGVAFQPVTSAGGVSLAAMGATGASSSLPLFSNGLLNLFCELDLAGSWTDTSGYVYQRDGTSPPVTVTRGKPDESGTVNPASCAWTWNNRDGRFSPRNPLSPYFGQLTRNAPVRWSVPAKTSYLRLEADASDRAYVNDNSTLHVSGDLELRMALQLSDWQGCVLAARRDNTQPSWAWLLNADGTMTLQWWDNGGTQWSVTSSVPVPYSSAPVVLVAYLTLSGAVASFYAGPGTHADDSAGVNLLSAAGYGGTTSVRAGNAPLVVGWSNNVAGSQMLGRVNEFKMYSVSGTAAAAADGIFTAQAGGATAWTDPQGNAWHLAGGAEISSRSYRFHGEMSAQPPRWDVTGADMAVSAQAGGPLRRLRQGSSNTVSAIKRAITAQSGSLFPVAYWPMEDAAGASVLGSAVGGAPMTFDASPAPALASDSTFAASAPLPSFNGSRFQGAVDPYTGTGTWTVRFLLKLSPPSAGGVLLRVVTAGGALGVVYITSDTKGNLGMTGYAPGGGEPLDTGPVAGYSAAAGVLCSLEARPVSGGVQYNLVTVLPGASAGTEYPVTVASSLGAGSVTLVQPDVTGLFGGTVIGHLQVQSAWQSLFDFSQPLTGYTGETAAARYARLCGENGYQVRILGSPSYSAAMGPQGTATLSSLLDECEAADGGQQFEPRQQLALGYRTLASICSQAPRLTLDYSQSHPGGVSGGGDSGLDPTYDDQLSANDWTVTRGAASGSQGATVQVTLDDGSAMSISPPPDGIGDYAKTATVNVEYDAQLQDVAGWMVHAGTVDEARWPLIPLNLARAETVSLQAAAMDLDIGDCLQLSNIPGTVLYDPVKQVVLGTKEALGGFHYTMEFNAVPESPYEVILLDDPVYGRVDTDGSTLHATATYPQATLSVDTAAGFPLWTTSSSDFPFDINVAGMRLTVSNITGTSGTQTFTVTPAVNGVQKTLPAGADVRLWFPPVLALT